MYDIVIVGAGTAGLSAAIYGVRAGKRVLILEATSYGGQIISTPEIVNYPGIKNTSGFEFATNLYEQAIELGAEFKLGKVTKIIENEETKIVVTGDEQYECKAVILATGAKNRPLGLKNEKKLIGYGISYCATCDGAFYKGKEVAVAGGGNTALEDARYLTAYCKKVYLIHRRDTFRGEQKLIEELKEKENIEFILDSNILEIIGDKEVCGVLVKNKNNGEEMEIKVDGLFVAIGQMPENHIFKDLIFIDDSGYIKAGENCKTNVDGIFTAGDCRTKAVRQLATASSDGAVAALAACEYIG